MSGDRRVRISRQRLLGLVVALACLAFSAIGLKVYDTPSYMYVDGQRGEVVTVQDAEIRVDDVAVGTRLVRDGQVKAETKGMFVAVTVTLATPGREKVYLNQAQLITQNRTYDSWSSNALSAQPGFEDQQTLYFEVDPAQIDDLTLEIWYGAAVYAFYARGRIHLGITGGNADQWRHAATGRALDFEYGGTTSALP